MFKKLKRSALGAKVPHDKPTAGMQSVQLPLPEKVRILMSQHIGAPAKPVVKKGDAVCVGTLVGEAGGFVSANIHSSVSGTVVAVEPWKLANGRICDSIVIETDGKQTVDPAVKPPVVTDKESFLKAVRDCGLVGLGGAGFPADVKLQPKAPVDTLLINASECEILLTSDNREMLDNSDSVLAGISAVLKYTGIPKCVIGIENNKPEAIDLLTRLTKDMPEITVHPLAAVYGTGAELILIEKCLGREVPHGGLPCDAGAVVMNVTSVSVLGKYLATGMPLVSRRITVDGDACANPCNVDVPVGTAIEDVLNFAGVKEGTKLGKVIGGGGMMGPALADLTAPTTKTAGGFLMLSEESAKPAPVSPCIKCGRCVEYCPLGLQPVSVAGAFARKDVAELARLHVDYCFTCGSCSFVCPAKRPVTQMMTMAKDFYLTETKGGKK